MVTTAIVPEKTVSDDHRRDTGGGHRDDGHEEGIQQADSDTKRKKVTNKHHQRGESSQQGHAVLVRSEVERLEAPEEFTAWCKTQTSDLTVAVETGSEEKVDLKASFVQLEAANESLRTKIRDLDGCVTITKELSQRYGLWEQNPTETELQDMTNEMKPEGCRCFVVRQSNERLVHSEACSQLRMQIGRLEVEAASRVDQLNKARQIQARRETVPISAGLKWHIAAHMIRVSSSRRGREIRHRGFPAGVFHSRPRER